jgi:hypothetical protein
MLGRDRAGLRLGPPSGLLGGERERKQQGEGGRRECSSDHGFSQ